MIRLLILLNLVLTFNLYGEEIAPSGSFISDSVKLGEPIKFSLSVHRSPKTQILFPDSGYNFSPFELIRKEYFATVTKNNRSFDSAVYILRTFTIQSDLLISLPIYLIHEGDSTAYYTPSDTVYLKQYLPGRPVSMDLQDQAEFTPIEQSFNYPYVIAFISLFLLLALVLYFFYGKTIHQKYRLFKVRSDHNNFEKNYKRLQKEFLETKGSITIEQALSIWKAYLARLENKPIYTYTSTEIINLYNKEELKNGLTIIDRAIYGGVISDEAVKALATLKRFSNRRYHKRKREIQNV